MVDDWRAAVEDLKDNVRHEIITLTNLARELTNIAYPIADVLEQHIKKVGTQHANGPSSSAAPSCPWNSSLTSRSGSSTAETASHLPVGLDSQECRHPLHALLWQELVPDLHGSVRLGRPENEAEAGRDATDLERARPWLHRLNSCLPSRCHPPDRERAPQSQDLCPSSATGTGPPSDGQQRRSTSCPGLSRHAYSAQCSPAFPTASLPRCQRVSTYLGLWAATSIPAAPGEALILHSSWW